MGEQIDLLGRDEISVEQLTVAVDAYVDALACGPPNTLGARDPIDKHPNWDVFALSLRAKRAEELARFVPLTLKIAPNLLREYTTWLSRHPAPVRDTVWSPGLAEGLRAGPFLATRLADDVYAPYAQDLLRWELLRAASRSDGLRRTARFAFDVEPLAMDIERGVLPTEALPKPTDVVFRGGFTPEIHRTGVRRVANGVRRGLSYRRRWRADLLNERNHDLPDLLELVPDHFFANPGLVDALAERFAIVLHDTSLSLGSPEGLDNARLKRISEVARRARAERFTDHLAITRSRTIELGHLAPLPRSGPVLQAFIRNIRTVQDALGLPVAVENIAQPFVFSDGMPEGEFLHELVQGTGCKLLLDVSNLVADAANGFGEPLERLKSWPTAAIAQLHLAGGRNTPRGYIDSHDQPVGDASYALLAALQPRLTVDAVVVEHDANLPTLDAVLGEAQRAVDVLERR